MQEAAQGAAPLDRQRSIFLSFDILPMAKARGLRGASGQSSEWPLDHVFVITDWVCRAR